MSPRAYWLILPQIGDGVRVIFVLQKHCFRRDPEGTEGGRQPEPA